MPDPRREAAGNRARYLRADRALRNELIVEYGKVWDAVKSELDGLSDQIKDARARGVRVSQAWLLRERRLARVEQQLGAQLSVFLDFAERRVTQAQIDALTRGQQDAAGLLRAALGAPPPGAFFEPALPVAQLERMVGRTSSGKPLGRLLATLGPDAASAVRTQLLVGVAVGRNPRETARQVRRALGGNMARALNIARTETLGVYRAAARETYRANRDVVAGWVWHAQLSHRTCPICWSMHGTFHTLDETLDSHASCRCAMVPQTQSWAELGFPDVRETRWEPELGEDVFARSDPELQRAVLGPAKFDAYQAGRIRLPDLVARTDSPTWGRGRRERSLRDALGVAA